MQKITQYSRGQSKADYALAMASYSDEQERTMRMVNRALAAYEGPTRGLDEIRAMLQERLGDLSLSDEIINMREEGP